MRRLLPIALALAAAALYFRPLSAQRPVFTTGTAAELAQARSIGLDHLRAIASQKGIDDADDLVVSNAQVDRLSMAHVRVQQRYNRIPVLGGEAIAHLNADGSQFADTDNLVAAINVSTTPTLTPDAAINVAVADYGCRGCLTRAPTADLWIVRDNAGVDHLTYRVQLARLDGTNQTALPVRFVDAHGGYVVLAYDNLQTATGNSLYSGTVLIGDYPNPMTGDHVLQNLGLRVGTFDLRNASSTTTFFPFLNASDDWSSFDQAPAVDAHYAMERFFDYLFATHGRSGIDGAGGPFTVLGADGVTSVVASMVHYGVNYTNAFWDTSKKFASFGDGNGTSFSPLVTLDIVGHELMHGVTQFTANLIYQNESGALNESWSDVFGAMLERHVRGESGDTWLLGEQAYTPAVADDALRYMDNPHRGNQPDHYSERFICDDEPQFCDNGGVHINSGIANQAFYLLAHGGTHRLGGSMTGIGADAAARIWFTALTSYMTSSSTFAGARTATTLAAETLFGNDSVERQAVARAWCLVGVGTCVTVEAVSVSPNAGASTTQTFTFQYSNSAGAIDLKSRVRFASTSNQGAGSCSLAYSPYTQTIQLMDDGGTFGPAVPLGSGTLSNSQCTVNLASSTATPSGNTLTLVLTITFSGTFSGVNNIYMLASSTSTGLTTGWVQRGTWTASGIAAVSATPGSGAGFRQLFTLQYADSSGASDIASARVRFGSSNASPGSCTARYNPATEAIELLNDAGTLWSAGTMGSGVLANSQCTLNLGSSVAVINGTSLTVVLDVTFSTAFAGLKQIYMLAASAGGANTGWQQRGTWTVTTPTPQALSVSPASGSGTTQSFTLRYSDPNGAAALTSARVRFGASNVGPGTCSAWYDASAATIRLMNDSGTWGGPAALGSGALSNSQCTLNLASSSATLNGNSLTVVLNVTFSGAFVGVKQVYMLAGDATTTTSWQSRGTWIVPKPGLAVSMTPNTGAGYTQAFTLAYSNTSGAANLTSVRVRFGASNVGPGTCTVKYDVTSGAVGLLDDAGIAWTAGTLGSGTLSNAQCRLNLASSSAALSGTNLSLVLNITFSTPFFGSKNVYMLANDATGATTGWLQRGSWQLPAPSLFPNTDAEGLGFTQAFQLTYFDSAGVADITSARVRFGSTNVGPGTCTAMYNPMTNAISLLNDAGTSWTSGPFGTGTLSNSQCRLNLGSSSASTSLNGTLVTVLLNITFSESFAGTKDLYMLEQSFSGISTGWLKRGTWTVPDVTTGTVMFFDSQPGDEIGLGVQRLFTPDEYAFTTSRIFAHGVNVTVQREPGSLWYLDFFNTEEPLHVGSYDNATGLLSPFAGMDIFGENRWCSSLGSGPTHYFDLTGRYNVLEIEYDDSGNVTRFAVDFEQHCHDSDAGLFGSLRYHSTLPPSIPIPWDGQYPSYKLRVTPPTFGRIEGDGIECGGGGQACDLNPSSPTAIQLTAIPDAGYVFAGWTGKCHGGQTMVVHVNTEAGCSAMFIPLTPGAPSKLLFWNSQPGDWIGQGAHEVYAPANSGWTASVLNAGNGVQLSLQGPTTPWWSVSFSAPTGQQLLPGQYVNAAKLPSATVPGLDVTAFLRSCVVVAGSFVVHDISIADGTLSSLAVDFEQHCEGASAPLIGSIRYNSTVPITASLAVTITGNGQVTLSPSGTTCTSNCAENAVAGASYAISAHPDPGWSFVAWTGDEDCVDGSLTLTAPIACHATFQQTGSVLSHSLPIGP